MYEPSEQEVIEDVRHSLQSTDRTISGLLARKNDPSTDYSVEGLLSTYRAERAYYVNWLIAHSAY